jgi:hypothetical protein
MYMKKIVLTYGLIAGAIVGGLMFATWPLHEDGTINADNGMLVGYTTMVIALSLVFFGVKSYRDRHLNGAITFGKALSLGLLISLVAAVTYALSWEVMYHTVASNFAQMIADNQMEVLQREGASAEAMATAKKEMEEFAVMYDNLAVRFGFTLLEILPVGILISLVSAALLRKKEFLSATE